MKKLTILLTLSVLVLNSCATKSNYVNMINSDAKSVNYKTLKSAEACTILDLFGDRSIKEIASKGNITKILSVDEHRNYGIFFCTTVHGE